MNRYIVVINDEFLEENPSVFISCHLSRNELGQTILQAVSGHLELYEKLSIEAEQFLETNMRYFDFNKETEDYSEAELTLLSQFHDKRDKAINLDCTIELEDKMLDLNLFVDLCCKRIRDFKVLTPNEWFDYTVEEYSVN